MCRWLLTVGEVERKDDRPCIANKEIRGLCVSAVVVVGNTKTLILSVACTIPSGCLG